MGKNLKGRELGVGISQRKDGLYTARFTDSRGRRRQKYFRKLQDCRKWLADAQFGDEHGDALLDSPTVDAWFRYWVDNIKGDVVRPQSRETYISYYRNYISPCIGGMLLRDVQPAHCQKVLSDMLGTHEPSTIRHTRSLLSSICYSACENGLVARNPVTKGVRVRAEKKRERATVLTREEQKKLLESMKRSKACYSFAFVLQTGLRVGELAGLKWGDVDWIRNTIHVSRTLRDRHGGGWIEGPTKTKSGTRDIPLTKEAANILKKQRLVNASRKITPIGAADYIFLSKCGRPRTKASYNDLLKYHCAKCGIPEVSMHILRHTFATRCIEAGMNPKTLQIILGHAKIQTTLDLYVHVTDERRAQEMERIEGILKLV